MMKKITHHFLMLFVLLAVTGSFLSAEEVVVPLSNPNAPCTIKAYLHTGGITVTGYNGKEVIVNAVVATAKVKRSRERDRDGEKEIVICDAVPSAHHSAGGDFQVLVAAHTKS